MQPSLENFPCPELDTHEWRSECASPSQSKFTIAQPSSRMRNADQGRLLAVCPAPIFPFTNRSPSCSVKLLIFTHSISQQIQFLNILKTNKRDHNQGEWLNCSGKLRSKHQSMKKQTSSYRTFKRKWKKMARELGKAILINCA